MEQEKKQKASAGKEPPKGKVLSSDYREMFENTDGEVSVIEPETPPTESSETVSKQESPVQAAVKAAQEGLDLLQEETEETPERKRPEREPDAPAFRAKGTHRRPALITGVIVLLLALTGVGFLATEIGQQIYTIATDDSRERAYDDYLEPLVMQDPEPFSSYEAADPQMVLSASLWKALSDNSASYTEYDQDGRTLVPLADVSDACHALFGPQAELELSDSGQENFFTFDETINQFHVTPYSTQSSYLPYTESIRTEDGKTVLKVGYVAPTDSWREESGEDATPAPVKYMEYVLVSDGQNEYVEQVREPEEGSAPSTAS